MSESEFCPTLIIHLWAVCRGAFRALLTNISVLVRSGPAGGSEGVPAEGPGGPAQTDGGDQCHSEPAAVPHVEGEGGVQPGAGRSSGKRSSG